MKISMIGSGYVGLVSGAGFSEFGHHVICVDQDPKKIALLKSGKLPIYEPGLDSIVMRNLKEGRLSFTTDIELAVNESDVIFITVGTPQATDGSADLSQVFSVAETIGEILSRTNQPKKVVVVKSTVPVGTTKAVGVIISSHLKEQSSVANNPEFLREGTAVEDFMRPDRVVIGTDSIRAKNVLMRLYRPFDEITSVMFTDPTSSELVKYAANSLLATRVSFMNELANLASAFGADIDFIRDGVGSDNRIGPKYLYPGPGYGGSCFPKDVSAMINMSNLMGIDLHVVKAAQTANEHQIHILGKMVNDFFNNSIKGKKISVLGTAFKAETDDVRDSPALALIDDMLSGEAVVTVYDPQSMQTTRSIYGDRISYSDGFESAIVNADAIVLCTEWRQFRNPDVSSIKSSAPNAAVFDGRNIWDPSEFNDHGIKYFGIGRGRPGKEKTK